MNGPHILLPWQERYEQKQALDSSLGNFLEWNLPAVKASMARGEHVPQMVLNVAIGPGEFADLYSAMWAYGRHFCMKDKDLNKKTTFDSSIAAMYSIDGKETHFFGYVESIVTLDFDSFQTVLIL
jgi:hypothetical protein